MEEKYYAKFNPEDKAYIIEFTIFNKEVVVVKFASGMYLVKYPISVFDIK